MSNQNLRRDEAATRSALITTHSYDVSLDVRQAADPKVAGYSSRSIINFTASEPGASTFLDFIASEVHSVFLNGQGLPVADIVDGSRIRLDNLQAENQVTVTGTALYSTSGEGMHRFFDPADGQCYLYTQYEPADARRVFANFEQPDLKAEFTFHVTAPAQWQVSSNGVETVRTPLTSDPALGRWDFAPTKAMSTYITTVLAGPYFKAEDTWTGTLEDGTRLEVPLALYCRASMADSFDTGALFRLTRNGLDFFNGLFDFPYPWGKYEQAFVPEYNLGAMENPGLVTFTESYVFTSRAADSQYQARANTLLHEMAHMWFGDLVTMQWWDDLWLKESFADYMGTLGVDRTTDWNTAWVNFANNRKAWAYVQDQLPTTHPIVADIPDLEAAKQNFDGITYAKGASVLKQLVAYVGFEAFIAGSRQYFKDHAYGNTTLADLLAALSAASGRDLGDWARQWLQTSGISTITSEIEEHDGVPGTVLGRVTLVQDAEDPITGRQVPRPHRLRIGLYNRDAAGALVRTDSVETDVSGPRTEVTALAGKPRPALLLVNDDDLSYAKIRLDPRSEATARSSLDELSDPMARALCWTALWDSARDAVTPSSLYVDAVERFGPAETGVGVLLNVLGNAATAIERYVPRAERGAVRHGFLATAAIELEAAEPGSDQQLAWARTLAATSRYDAGRLDLVRGILDGSAVFEGLAVDAELRWNLWHALSANGQASPDELDAELARDNTAAGKSGHATALAARPEAGVKAAAWRAAVHGTALSNQLLSATIAGFTTGDASLLSAFIEPYFECLETVWAGRSIEIASRIVRGLYPAGQDLDGHGGDPATHPVIVRTDNWLTGHPDAPRALRRIVIEQRSHLLRALKAQALGGGGGARRRPRQQSVQEGRHTMDLRLQGKTVLITGASQGIGRETALLLAEEGCNLILVSRDARRLNGVADTIRARHGVSVSVLAADLSSDAGLKLVGSSVGDLDVLVNNAGAIPPGTLQEIDDRQWREAWDLKVFGYISLTRSLYAKLKGRQGVIVNIIGAGGETFRPDYIAGATGNAALMAFTRALGKSAAQDQMRVVGINPGPVSTPRNEVMLRAKAKAEFGDESRWTELNAALPYGRSGTPEEIASAVAFLASPRSGYTNGTILTIDGGPGS